MYQLCFFFSSRRRHTRCLSDWSSDVCSSDLVEGDNEAGLGYRLTQQWATAGIDLQGLTMAVLGGRFIGFAAFDTVADANRSEERRVGKEWRSRGSRYL